MTDSVANDALFRVVFVCRGSVADGLGHVTRTRTVALACATSLPVKLIVIGDSSAEALLRNRGLEYEVVSDSADALKRAQQFGPQVVVFDLMEFPEAAFDEIQKAAMTVSLSPIFNCLERVDVVFHRTSYRGEGWPTGDRPLVRSGLDYAVVREDCQRIPSDVYSHHVGHSPLSIAISMGGADAGNKTLRVLESLRKVPCDLLFWVLLGEGYGHSYQDLVDCIRDDPRHEIILAKTNNSMWRIMGSCSLAILAGGTVTYEAAYARLPSINVFEVADHVFLVQELVDHGTCISAGYSMNDALHVINANVALFEKDRGELLTMHERCTGLIDGRGATRIVDEISEFYRRYAVDRKALVGLALPASD